MKHQALFFQKNTSKKLKCHLLQFLFGASRVKTVLEGGNLVLKLNNYDTSVFDIHQIRPSFCESYSRTCRLPQMMQYDRNGDLDQITSWEQSDLRLHSLLGQWLVYFPSIGISFLSKKSCSNCLKILANKYVIVNCLTLPDLP